MTSLSLADSRTVDRRVEAAIGAQLRHCAGSRRRIEKRLRELDEEWDLESVLDAQASLVASLGTVVGAVVNRRLPSVPMSWSAGLVRLAASRLPMAAALRRIGIRTSREIEIERLALRLLRGDLVRHPVSLRKAPLADLLLRH